MIDVLARGSVASYYPFAGNPVHNRPGVLFVGNSIPYRIQINEGIAVVMSVAFLIDTGDEAAGLVIPEEPIGFDFDRLGVLTQPLRFHPQCSQQDAPARMAIYRFFYVGHRLRCGIVLVGRIEIVPAEGHKVPVVIANPMSGGKGSCSFLVFVPARQTVVARPGVANVIVFETPHNRLLIPQGKTHTINILLEKIEVARPVEIALAGQDKYRIVDGVACVINSKERINLEPNIRFSRRQGDADTLYPALPLRMPIHRYDGVGKPGRFG